jgi:hypothetical protein
MTRSIAIHVPSLAEPLIIDLDGNQLYTIDHLRRYLQREHEQLTVQTIGGVSVELNRDFAFFGANRKLPDSQSFDADFLSHLPVSPSAKLPELHFVCEQRVLHVSHNGAVTPLQVNSYNSRIHFFKVAWIICILTPLSPI